MSLFIYNTLSRKKEKFVSLSKNKVKMYVCGPTVYGLLHIGNFRGLIFFQFVRHWLKRQGYEVNFVYNYTDVDDKIIQRAKEENLSNQDLANKYIESFEKDFQSFKMERPSHMPRVTEYMKDIVNFISELIEEGKAYESNGSVYYSVEDFKNYGTLSHKALSELIEGEKSEGLDDKKSSFDFALWKASKPGEPFWESPWGSGRPGWHIECSTMIRSLLGEVIDIHGGGIDLVFPHHENEKAQTEALTKKPFVRYWMHHNMIEFQDQKMSKSLGNVQNMRDFLKDYNAEIFKCLIFSVHYRSVLNFHSVSIYKALQSLSRIYSSLAFAEKNRIKKAEMTKGLKTSKNKGEEKESDSQTKSLFLEHLKSVDQRIEQSINDDFNTPEMMARIFETVKLYNFLCRGTVSSKSSKKGGGEQEREEDFKSFKKEKWEKFSQSLSNLKKQTLSETFSSWIRKWGKGMSLFQEPPQTFLKNLDDLLLKKKGLEREEIDKMVQERGEMRRQKNFQRADAIRDHLWSLGISLQDISNGESVWEVSKHFEETS